jgi:ABC-type multidrug transport system ATPase subunit
MSAGGGPAIHLRGVTVGERGRLVLAGVDLTVAAGHATGVGGPNGSGKSTLLRVAAGLCRPRAGAVWIGGWDALRRADQVRRLIGYVPERPGLAERLTSMEHLALVAAQRGLSRADGQAAGESMLELVDLEAVGRQPVATLSPGQQRRLAIALALVHDPPIVLVDEPSAGLDDVGRGELLSVLQELRSMEKTLLIASQVAADVAEVCDEVVQLAHGRLLSPEAQAATAWTWLEVVGEVEAALRTLRERPGIGELRREGNLVTCRQDEASPEERARLAAWLIAEGVQLAGFGVTSNPVVGESR